MDEEGAWRESNLVVSLAYDIDIFLNPSTN